MASKQELENQKALNKAIKDQTKSLEAQTQSIKDGLALSKEQVQNQRDISNVIRDQTKDLQFQKQERSELLSIGRSLNKIAQDNLSFEDRTLGTSKDIAKISKQREEVQNRIKQIQSLQNNILEGTSRKQQDIKDSLKDQEKSAKELEQSLAETENYSKGIASSFGVKAFSGLSGMIKNIPGLGVLSTPFEDAYEAARATREEQVLQVRETNELSKEYNKMFDTGEGLTKGVIKRLGLEKKIGTEIAGPAAASRMRKMGLDVKERKEMEKLPGAMKSITSGGMKLASSLNKAFGVGLVIAFTDELLLVNSQTVELQKSLALSASEATDLRQEFAASAASSENINISTTALLETVTALSKQFGFPTLFDKETLITTTKLTKQVGISAESAGMLAAATVTTGKNFEDQYKDALGTSYELQRQAGVQLDLRNILEESGKVTGTIRANLGSNVETIAAAVTQAKLFGGSLDDVANASKALLDFESSITAELEAELLLGKNINLETARQASLNGDMVTVAKELRKEAGDYTEFSKMNVIQQEALAKAMGMQSDQLADILFQQDIQGKTAGELRALGKDELADRLEAQTAQEKFNASVAKLKGLLGDVVTAFMPLIDVLSGIFGVISKVIAAIQPLIGFFTGMAAGALIGGVPGAIIGGITGLISDVSKADDAIIPTTGYGDTIIKSGKDTIALNNEDSVAVVAGTNLGGGSNKTGERTNQLLESLIMQNAKKPEISPVGLYEVQ